VTYNCSLDLSLLFKYAVNIQLIHVRCINALAYLVDLLTDSLSLCHQGMQEVAKDKAKGLKEKEEKLEPVK